MKTVLLPVLGDNYIHVLNAGGEATVVDPGMARPVIMFLHAQQWKLQTVLLTHGHGDHVAGAEPLKKSTGCTVIGPAGSGIPGLDREVRGGDRVAIPGGEVEVLDTPGHLPVHASYYDAANAALYCGDALFGAGCGRVLGGGTAAQLFASLNRLRQLPGETRVFCGHEYTVDNLAFAAQLEPERDAVQQRLRAARAAAAAGKPTVPSTLTEELATNPFLRTEDPALAQALGMPGAAPLAVFTALRRRKDAW